MSARAKPTPGPMHVGGRDKCTIYDKFSQRVANTFEGVLVTHRSDSECQANAHLFAEAGTVLHETGRTPRHLAEERAEMLEALSRLVACYSTSNSPKVRESCWDQARAAIAKATGGAA